MKNNISIIVPAKNEESNLLELIKRINTSLTSYNIIFEIIVIDDYSTDNTQQLIKKIGKN